MLAAAEDAVRVTGISTLYGIPIRLQGREAQQGPHRLRVPRIRKALDNAVPRRRVDAASGARSIRIISNARITAPPYADRVQEEAPALSDSRDDQSRDRGAHNARAVQHGGIQRNGVDDVVAIDGLGEKRLPRRDVERVRDAQQRRERDNLPHADVAAKRERREDERQRISALSVTRPEAVAVAIRRERAVKTGIARQSRRRSTPPTVSRR